MVIQRVYSVDDTGSPPKPSNSPSRSQRSSTVDGSNLATSVESSAVSGAGNGSTPAVNGVLLKRTPSTSTAKTGTNGAISRLIAQHTGGSLAPSEHTSGAGSSRPSSPLEFIRTPSSMSVLKPSDFARRKAAFQKSEPGSKFHAELERHYANPPSPLDLKELPQKVDGVPRGTFVIPKLRSASANTPASSSFLTPPAKIATGSLTASPEASPVSNSPVTQPTPSPKVELQVLELNKQVMDSTVENKTLAAEISNMEKAVMNLQDAHRAIEPKVSVESLQPGPTVPKAEFDALLKDTEKAAKELEEIEKKSEERQKELEALAAQATRLQSKAKALETTATSSDNMAAKETLEAAVERLREQVEVARRQSADVSRRLSSSSKVSERYGQSATRVPLAWGRRANATETSTPPTPTNEKVMLDDTKSISTAASRNPNRRSQVIAIAPAEPLPEREDLQRTIKSYYTESVRSPTIMSPPLPTIKQSDNDGPSTEELSRDINAIVEGFATESFDTGILSFTTPVNFNAKTAPSKTLPSKTPTPMSPTKLGRGDSMSIRSKRSAGSLKDVSLRNKKKGWTSLFKVKLPGGTSIEEDRKAAKASPTASKAPMLAPISQSTPLSLNL